MQSIPEAADASINHKKSFFSSDEEAEVSRQIIEGEIIEAWDRSLAEKGEPKDWKGRRGQTVAARLLSIMGDERSSDLIHLRNFREFPDDPTACFYSAFRVNGRFGQLRALKQIREFFDANPPAEDDISYSDLFGLQAILFESFRDFPRARESLDEAQRRKPNDTWFFTLRSSILLNEDRVEESLEVAEEAFRLTPNYRAVVRTLAARYWMLNRDDEAINMLKTALKTSSSPDNASQLATYYDETGEHEEGLKMLDEYEKRCLRADKATRRWISGFRASALYQLGRGDEMALFAKKSKAHFYKKIAKRVKSGDFSKGKRIRLAVPFVRQNELTCGPATLTALARYFGKDAEHLDVVDEICYAGTTDFREREWAGKEGWSTREFRVDWDTTRKLIDLGLPFALATVEPTSAHLQAVIGYDSRAGTVIIRDPGRRHYVESLQKGFFKDYAHCGPRGLLLIPKEKESLISDIELPEAILYDLVFELNKAIDGHDREKAHSIRKEIGRQSKNHRMFHHATYTLACYDDDPRGIYEAASALAELFPKAAKCQYSKYRGMSNLVSRDERLTFLRKQTSKERKTIFPLFFKEEADVLVDDARTLDRAWTLYRRTFSYRSHDASVLYGMAGLLWKRREYEEATDLYRFASCLDDRDEFYAENYFKVRRWRKDAEGGVKWLQQRYQELGDKSSGPVSTLCKALHLLDRDDEVAPLLENALQRLPGDGDLLVFAAGEFANMQKIDRARKLLDEASDTASDLARLRMQARIEARDSNPDEAIKAWEKILEIEPLSSGAHSALADLIGKKSGTEAAISFLEQAAAMFPHHVPIQEELIGWLRDEEPGRAEAAIRNLLDFHPSNSWAWRELAVDLYTQTRFEESLQVAETGCELEPLFSYSHSILARSYEELRDFKKAENCFRRSLELDVENSSAMNGLIRVSQTSEEKRRSFSFVEKQLEEQVIFGDGMLTFQQVGWTLFEPDELLKILERANAARPDLWQTWTVLGDQFRSMGRLDEALKAAAKVTELFPTLPRLWLDLSYIHRELKQQDDEIAALEQCLQLNPQWDRPLRRLAEVKEDSGAYDDAAALLEKAIKENPFNAANYGMFADLQWKQNDRGSAFETLLKAVRADHDYGWGWATLGEWGSILSRQDEVIEEGENLTRRRPSEDDSWLRLSEIFEEFENNAEQMQSLDDGLALHPMSESLRDEKARILCSRGLFDDALAVCHSDHWNGGERPYRIAGREAGIYWDRGEEKKAIELMEDVAKKHENYCWAHERLSDWHSSEGDLESALKHATHLVRLSPHDAQAHGFLASIQIQLEKLSDAEQTLEKSFTIDPCYTYAGYQLNKILLDASRIDEAEICVRKFEYHNPSNPSPVELRIWLETLKLRNQAKGKQDQTPVIEAFKNLCIQPNVVEAILLRSEGYLEEALMEQVTRHIYNEIITDAEKEISSADVLGRWAATNAQISSDKVMSDLGRLVHLDEKLKIVAWRELIYELERLDMDAKAVKIIDRNESIFNGNDELWGHAGYIYRRCGYDKKAIKWLSDYRERDDVKPWMLLNLATSLFNTKGIAKSGPVNVYVATQLAPDFDGFSHQACAAFYEASRGNPASAREHLAAAEFGAINGYYQMIYTLAEYMTEFHENGVANGSLLSNALECYEDWRSFKPASKYFFIAVRRTFPKSLIKSGVTWLVLKESIRLLARIEL